MRFQASIRNSKLIRTFNSVEELPFAVKRGIGCRVWSECGFVGIDYDFVCGDYSQIMPVDREALNWIKAKEAI